MQEAIARHRGGDLAGALAVCEEVVARRPDMSAAHAEGAPAPPARPAGASDRRRLRGAFQTNPDDTSAAVLLVRT